MVPAPAGGGRVKAASDFAGSRRSPVPRGPWHGARSNRDWRYGPARLVEPCSNLALPGVAGPVRHRDRPRASPTGPHNHRARRCPRPTLRSQARQRAPGRHADATCADRCDLRAEHRDTNSTRCGAPPRAKRPQRARVGPVYLPTGRVNSGAHGRSFGWPPPCHRMCPLVKCLPHVAMSGRTYVEKPGMSFGCGHTPGGSLLFRGGGSCECERHGPPRLCSRQAHHQAG
jgi:hypothetical protein